LIEDEVLVLVPPVVDNIDEFASDYSLLLANPEILAQYLEMYPDERWRFDEDLERAADLSEVASMRAQAVCGELRHATVGAMRYPGSSHWFGHENDFELFLRIARATEMRLQGQRGEVGRAVAIARIEVADISKLSPGDVVGIRRKSEVFEDWRTALKDALAATEDIAVNGHTTPEGLEEIRSFLENESRKTQREIRDIKKDFLLGAVRSVGFGSIAAAGGGAIDGALGILSGVVGAASEAALDLSKDLVDNRKSIRSKRSFVRHAAVVAERPTA